MVKRLTNIPERQSKQSTYMVGATTKEESKMPTPLRAAMPPLKDDKLTTIDKGPIGYRTWAQGELASEGEQHKYTFDGREGQRIGVVARSPAHSKVDPYLILLGPGDEKIAEDDDTGRRIDGLQIWDAAIEKRLASCGSVFNGSTRGERGCGFLPSDRSFGRLSYGETQEVSVALDLLLPVAASRPAKTT